ncbi:hypothetical protein CEXT_220021 [Caerostris extrusa]|uniref:Secreted protein n=1 Tax=Caerostris extrusa TaxID=172846 RepID=A0AAV4NFB7_CAEEX|nr:hypothetical protein CEXT_220021 [Caerostris extrusa]
MPFMLISIHLLFSLLVLQMTALKSMSFIPSLYTRIFGCVQFLSAYHSSARSVWASVACNEDPMPCTTRRSAVSETLAYRLCEILPDYSNTSNPIIIGF